MQEYLVGIMFHEPGSLALRNRGIIEDYESTTGLFIEADSAENALRWGESVGEALLQDVNQDSALDWRAFGYYSWIEPSPSTSHWRHCLDFIQHVRVGQMPDFKRMTADAYRQWSRTAGK
jgi:hypothetical protein